MSNPPSPPPESGTKPPPPVVGSPVKAIVTGLAVDIGGSTLVGLLLSAFYAVQLSNSGLSPDDIQQAMDNIPADSPVQIAGTLLGACCSVAGGYVCARIVRVAEFRVGAVMAFLSAFFGLALGPGDTPDDMVALLTLSTVACVLLGVKYGREHNLRERRPASPPASPPADPPLPPRP